MVSLFKRLALEENCQSAGIASQQNPVQAMKLLRLKARNDVAKDTYQLISTVIVRDAARDKFTQTLEIMGVDKVLEIKKPIDLFEITFKHIQKINEKTQTHIFHTGELENAMVQTDFRLDYNDTETGEINEDLKYFTSPYKSKDASL